MRIARAPHAQNAIALLTAILLVLTGLGSIPLQAQAAPQRNLTELVDPFVGTYGDYGNDLPGAQVPNGLAKVNPMTMPGRNHSGYDYSQSQIAGFTNTNMDAVGGSGAGGDILIVPTSVEYTHRPQVNTYAHDFSHDDETARPGYYQVGLSHLSGKSDQVQKSGAKINAEVTSTVRTGLHRYTFPENSKPKLVFDLRNNFTERKDSELYVSQDADHKAELSGWFTGQFNGNVYRLYFYARTLQPVTSVRTWAGGSALDETASRSGQDTGAVLEFAETDPVVELQVTLSPISAEQAKYDQQFEIGAASFDQIRSQATEIWQDTLGRVDISASSTNDPSGELEKLFYTHLYRMFALPYNASSTDGRYRGADGAIHQVDNFVYYDGWSTWDDFRKYSVIAYIAPDLYRDIVQSLVYRMADHAGTGDLNPFAGIQGVPNVRYERSAVVVADAISKGFANLSRLAEAFPVLESIAGYDDGGTLRRGYIAERPGDDVQRSYDQWALAIIADAIGQSDKAEELRQQAKTRLVNSYQPSAFEHDGISAGLLTPRAADGSWKSVNREQFEPGFGLYQGTMWQYNWYPAHDMAALVDVMGGLEAALTALKFYFGEYDPDNGKAMLKSNANEIDLQTPYLFNYLGEPSTTQKWVRDIYTKETWNRYIATWNTDGNVPPAGNGEFQPPIKTKVYKLDPKGLLPTMDNDAATMSSMFVAAVLGMFPVTAGSAQYQVGSPFFESARINYPSGTSFTVSANGVSPENFYVQSAALNDAAWDNSWINFDQIVSGGQLAFQMGSAASDWAKDSAPAYSMSQPQSKPEASYPTVRLSANRIEADENGAVNGQLQVNLVDTTFAEPAGTDLIARNLVQLANGTTGLNASLVVDDPTTATLRLSGNLAGARDVWLQIAPEAFAGITSAAEIRGDGVSRLSPIRISVAALERKRLIEAIEQASLVRSDNYLARSFNAVQYALTSANQLLANSNATDAQLRSAREILQHALSKLELNQGGFRKVEAEEFDGSSGAPLKAESYKSAGNIGGVTNNSWTSYSGLDFAGQVPVAVQINYANYRKPDEVVSKVTIHAGDRNGPVVAKTDLPGTGDWGVQRTVTAEISNAQALMEAKSFTAVYTVSKDQWVANVDWFQFVDKLPETSGPDPSDPYVLEAEAWTTKTDRGGKKEGSNWQQAGQVQNIGDFRPDYWFDYSDVDFGDVAVTDLTVSYVNNSKRVGHNARLEIYVDATDPANLTGDPFLVVPLPVTGDAWNADGVTTAKLPQQLSGKHRITVVGRADLAPGLEFVSNVNSFTFKRAEVKTVLQAEEKFNSGNRNSGGALKVEKSNWNGVEVDNIGATYNGAWLDYAEVDFGSIAKNQVRVHYVGNSGRVAADAKLRFYLDAADPANPGDPIAEVNLPHTGSNWSSAGWAEAILAEPISSKHRITVSMHGSTDGNHPYIANLDRYEFHVVEIKQPEVVDKQALQQIISQSDSLVGQEPRFVVADFAVFQRALEYAKAIVVNEQASQAQVDAAERTLRIASANLTPQARRALENAVTEAAQRDQGRFTKSSWQAFQQALQAAQQALGQDGSDDDLNAARESLTQAAAALQTRATTVPEQPLQVAAIDDAGVLRVNWNAPSNDGGSAITGWIVRLDDGHEVRIGNPTQRAVHFVNLEPKQYQVSVIALNAKGQSEPATTAVETEQLSSAGVELEVEAGAPLGEPYPAGSLDRSFVSDRWPNDSYLHDMLEQFADLPAEIKGQGNVRNRAELTAWNDLETVRINNAATEPQIKRAVRDADRSAMDTSWDAFGDLRDDLEQALKDGTLPKTRAIVDRTGARIEGADTAKAMPDFSYQRPYLRLGLAGRGGLIYESHGSYDSFSGQNSYPSGHTYGGYNWGNTVATLVPELAPSVLARASEYGDNRIVLGYHYPLDVTASRMISTAVLAQRWSDPEFQPLLLAASAEIREWLTGKCGGEDFAECVGTPYAGLTQSQAVELFTQRATYGAPQIHPAGQPMVMPNGVGNLLLTKFPELSDAQRQSIIEQTALDSGYPLDRTHEGGESWQRVNLAAALSAEYELLADGQVRVTNHGNATVESQAGLTELTLDGQPLQGFEAQVRHYQINWPADQELPAVAAKASPDGAKVEVSQAKSDWQGSSANEPGYVVAVTSANGKTIERWHVSFYRTAVVPPEPTVQPSTPTSTSPEPAQSSSVTPTTAEPTQQPSATSVAPTRSSIPTRPAPTSKPTSPRTTAKPSSTAGVTTSTLSATASSAKPSSSGSSSASTSVAPSSVKPSSSGSSSASTNVAPSSVKPSVTAATPSGGASSTAASTVNKPKVGGAIGAYWQAHRNDFGEPVNDEQVSANGVYQDFEGGRIYWLPGGPAHAARFGFDTIYQSLGQQSGRFGYPTSDESQLADGRAIQAFERGTLVWQPASGVHIVEGAIHAAWLSAGGAAGSFGLPTSNEIQLGGYRVVQHFEGGDAYWAPGAGAWFVASGNKVEWERLGGINGYLGAPTGNEVALGGNVVVQTFQGGRIYWSPQFGARAVHGGILARYLEQGGAHVLGVPTTGEFAYGGGVRQDFARGLIMWP